MLIEQLLFSYKQFKFALECIYISRKNNLILDKTWFDI